MPVSHRIWQHEGAVLIEARGDLTDLSDPPGALLAEPDLTPGVRVLVDARWVEDFGLRRPQLDRLAQPTRIMARRCAPESAAGGDPKRGSQRSRVTIAPAAPSATTRTPRTAPRKAGPTALKPFDGVAA